MSETSIKISIAGRNYPLTISQNEVASLKTAVVKIEENIDKLKKNYSVTDKQDLLAMTALEIATESQKKDTTEAEKIVTNLISKISSVLNT